jgi:hypothetical protein
MPSWRVANPGLPACDLLLSRGLAGGICPIDGQGPVVPRYTPKWPKAITHSNLELLPHLFAKKSPNLCFLVDQIPVVEALYRHKVRGT